MQVRTWCAITLFPLCLMADQLPQIQGENLLGKAVILPNAASGRIAVLVVGFTHGSQTQAKAWSVRLQRQFPRPAQEVIYSIAVLQDVPRLLRGMVVHGIKNGIPQEQRDRFLLVYRNESELKQMAGFGTPDDAYLLVVDQGGSIRWRFHGPVSDGALEQLVTQVRAWEQSGAK